MVRIASANCGSVAGQTFTYDPFGNIDKSGSPNSFSPVYTNTRNRIYTVGTTTAQYDNNGNVLNDGVHNYTWDADGNSITVDTVGATFDALDRMVEQNRSSVYTEIVYAPTGAKLALMSGTTGQTLQNAFINLPGKATAVYTSSGLDHYRHSDWLGSARLTSSPSRTVLSTTAYAPFGETYATYPNPSASADPSFTGQNSDTVSGEYDFLAREYSTQGRWPSPDKAGMAAANPNAPQSWNRYAYVNNNPLGYTDPLGLYCQWDDGSSDETGDPDSGRQDQCEGAGGTWIPDNNTFHEWTPLNYAQQMIAMEHDYQLALLILQFSGQRLDNGWETSSFLSAESVINWAEGKVGMSQSFDVTLQECYGQSAELASILNELSAGDGYPNYTFATLAVDFLPVLGLYAHTIVEGWVANSSSSPFVFMDPWNGSPMTAGGYTSFSGLGGWVSRTVPAL